MTLAEKISKVRLKGFSLFSRFAWGVLVYNLAVILWGAYVRATGSGAGCGSHWPLCNGEILPRDPRLETVIELIHRASSGLAFLLVLGLLVWAWRVYPKGSLVRRGAFFAMIFITTEALIGAGLVLLEWVAQDASLGRAVSIVVHLVNTFLLLGSLALTAWWAGGERYLEIWESRPLLWVGIFGLLGMLSLGASGALAALGDTLFPARSLVEGLRQDFSPTAHFLLRLRLLHPTIAVVVGVYLILVAGFIRLRRSEARTRGLARLLTLIILIQLGAGALNLLLLAPVWMQLVHLFLADVLWVIFVLVMASALEGESLKTRHADQPEPVFTHLR